jgi:hypothetical protein
MLPSASCLGKSERDPSIGAESEGMIVGATQQKTSLCQIAFERYLHKDYGEAMSALCLPNRMLHFRYGLRLNVLLVFYTKCCHIDYSSTRRSETKPALHVAKFTLSKPARCKEYSLSYTIQKIELIKICKFYNF